MHSNLIAARCAKQRIVALSSTEAEYIALSDTARQLKWLFGILDHLHIPYNTPTIYVDNRSAMILASSNRLTDRSKHIDETTPIPRVLKASVCYHSVALAQL